MKSADRSKKLPLLAALILLLSGITYACTLPQLFQSRATPAAAVTQEVTRLVTQVQTQEVTRLVEILVPVPPAALPLETPLPTSTPAPSDLPMAVLVEKTDCLYGPADFFLYKTSLEAGVPLELLGRNPQGTWLAVRPAGGWDSCWIPSRSSSVLPEQIQTASVIYPSLPRSYWYKPPGASAKRSGSAVTISWKAIWMTPEDYRGYLIEAWVCQGGEHGYLPVSVMPPYGENTGILSITIIDEQGCPQASQATIYTAEKRGYFGEVIFWPANQESIQK